MTQSHYRDVARRAISQFWILAECNGPKFSKWLFFSKFFDYLMTYMIREYVGKKIKKNLNLSLLTFVNLLS